MLTRGRPALPATVLEEMTVERSSNDSEILKFAEAVHYRARRIHSGTVAGDRLLIEQEAGALIYAAARFLRQRTGGDAA